MIQLKKFNLNVSKGLGECDAETFGIFSIMSDNIFNQKKAFNFYRSYYETSLLLQKEDKAEFLEAILHYQFTGELIEPNSPMALLAFRGQIHSLRKQVIGYEMGKNTYPNGNPTKGKYKGEHKGSHKEVQEKEQVQDEVEEKEEIIDVPAKAEKIDFEKLIEFINKNTGRNFKVINKTVKGKYYARLKEGYTKQDILDAVSNSIKSDYHKGENFKYLTPEFFSRSETLDKYSNVNKSEIKKEPTKKIRTL